MHRDTRHCKLSQSHTVYSLITVSLHITYYCSLFTGVCVCVCVSLSVQQCSDGYQLDFNGQFLKENFYCNPLAVFWQHCITECETLSRFLSWGTGTILSCAESDAIKIKDYCSSGIMVTQVLCFLTQCDSCLHHDGRICEKLLTDLHSLSCWVLPTQLEV